MGKGQEFVGKVISNRMQKSVLVVIDRLAKQKKYDRVLKRTTKLMAHDERDECSIGDTVRIHSCRPLSKNKSFLVTEILHSARVFDATAAAAAAGSSQQQQQQPFAAPSFASSAALQQNVGEPLQE